MYDVLISTVTGLLVGILFTAIKLPIPGPPTLAAVMGVVGIYLGMHVCHLLIRLFFT